QFNFTDFDPGGQDDIQWTLLDTADNIWQVGPPQKSFFTTAYSAPNVLVTDTVAPYPPNDSSAVLVKFPLDFMFMGQVFFVSFYQAFDTDSLQDGGYIHVSWDHGATWTNIFDDWMMPLNIEFLSPEWDVLQPDTLSNGQIGFSGRSLRANGDQGWCYTSFCWTNIGLDPVDTLYMRFAFHSDSIAEARDGWMLDDLSIQSFFAHPVSALERADDYFFMAPNPMADRTQVVFDLDEPQNTVHVALYDGQGRLVRVLRDGTRPPGKEVLMLWRDELGLKDGLYHVVAEVNGATHHRALVVNSGGSWHRGED
ncbi:MAG TPA: hypothetical protein VHL57_01275, partial [Flavobacteriales bacterium]|nr:hypothetical protein [Flavobacteriales bacterium]